MKKFGLLGRSLSHSRSPELHQLLGSVPYALYEVEPEELAHFLRTTDLTGLNVTIPYKKAVLPYCAALSDTAKQTGSVNTLLRRDNGWYGDNTDHYGFSRMVDTLGVSVSGKKALILGSGGAAGTVKAVLNAMGVRDAVVISRTGENNYTNLGRHRDAQILVNATPVGMYPKNGEVLVSLGDFPCCEAVLDLIYHPLRSALLLDAKARAIPCANGLTMLAAQAFRSAELFLEESKDEAVIDALVHTLRRKMENVVLIGMPGCGKTAVGRRLAAQMGREFADSDEVFQARFGITPEAFLTAYGEASFRAKETEVLSELGKRTGLVIATGGGCVTIAENLSHLRQNGKLVWLRREVTSLPVEGRPLSRASSPEALYALREPLYRAAADCITENSGSVEEAAAQIKEMFL